DAIGAPRIDLDESSKRTPGQRGSGFSANSTISSSLGATAIVSSFAGGLYDDRGSRYGLKQGACQTPEPVGSRPSSARQTVSTAFGVRPLSGGSSAASAGETKMRRHFSQ